MGESIAIRIARLALATFDSLPPKCKPRIQTDGKREWTPMSAIFIALDGVNDQPVLKCVALATGTKCLPASMLAKCRGRILHDCHAEILAFRGLNYWLLTEVERVLQDGTYVSPYIRSVEGHLGDRHGRCDDGDDDDNDDGDNGNNSDDDAPPFEIVPQVSIYLLSTTAPCGDASMELLISSKSAGEAVPWSQDTLRNDITSGVPLGRGHFSLLGAVRRKPARGDAEATMSKSCTDKIAIKQILGLVGFPVDLLIRRTNSAFLKGLIVYPDQFHDAGYSRAFGRSGRMHMVEKMGGHHFDTHVLPEGVSRFAFDRGENVTKVTNLSVLMVAGQNGQPDTVEVIVNGVKQGYKQLEERPGKASVVSRAKMMQKLFHIDELLRSKSGFQSLVCPGTPSDMYSEWKRCPQRNQRRSLKDKVVSQLGGWVTSASTDEFNVQMP